MDHKPEPGEGLKYDQGKVDLTILPWSSLAECARVLEYGASKYGRSNWRGVRPAHRYLAAAMRHLAAHIEGEEIDESGHSHIAHAATSILLYMAVRNENP